MRRLALALLLGCHAPAPPAFDAAAVARHERGAGVPRDFNLAARLYAEACHAGCGDLTACHGLLELAIATRGITPTLDDAPIATRMCRRGDATACISLALLGFDKGIPVPAPLECKADRIGCEAAMWMDVRVKFPNDGPPEPPTPAELRHDLTGPAAQLCARGDADGCIHLVHPCTDRACVDRRAAYLREQGVDPAPLRAAWDALGPACAAGDVDACDAAGTPIARPALCAAGDAEACGHDRAAVIKALQVEVVALFASCRAHDRKACDRIAAITSATCH